MGQVGGESITFGLTRHWQTERHPPDFGCDLDRARKVVGLTPKAQNQHGRMVGTRGDASEHGEYALAVAGAVGRVGTVSTPNIGSWANGGASRLNLS